MGQNYFARMPNIVYPRSKYKMPFDHSTSYNHGNLVPIDCFPVIPGDTMSLRLSSLIRMSTPIAPIMGNIHAHVHAFFVPMRLVWDYTEEFFGENKTSAGPQTTVYKIPNAYMSSGYGTGASDSIGASALSHYLGKPATNNAIQASVLKERAYYLIWNEWYRAQQLQDPVLISKTGNGANAHIGSLNGNTLKFSSNLLNVNKDFDYFTAATISPQYGPAVTLPLGTYAPIVVENKTSSNILSGQFGTDLFEKAQPIPAGGTKQIDVYNSSNTFIGSEWADLSQATAATINSIRYAFAVQKYLERSNFGSRYFEVLKAHYGVTSPDARLQRPEYLGGAKFNINVNQVTSVAGYAAGVTTTVGETGAVSVTANNSSIFTKGFVEFGFVFVMLSTTHEQSYSQGLMREDFLFDKYDFYSPEFANLGDQAIYNKEIMVTGTNDDDVFGYQEHWAELRYRPHRVSGLLDPNVSGSLDYWTLANKFSSRPSLGPTFIQENRDAITRCLKTGAAGPDYIGDFYFDYTATRELPVRSVPGLLDHVGNF